MSLTSEPNGDRLRNIEQLFLKRQRKDGRRSVRLHGRLWIRTTVGLRQQIYSLPPLATWVISHIPLELVDGLEPPTC